MKKGILTLIIFLLLLGNITIWTSNYSLMESTDYLEITFIDIGQGDSILIKTPNNTFGLIDGGRGENLESKIGELIPYTVNELEFIILTHPDADHIEGIVPILNKFKVNNVFLNKSFKGTEILKEITDILENKEIKNYGLNNLNDFEVDSVEFNVIWPNEDYNPFLVEDYNDSSIGLTIHYKDFTLLTAGDLSSDYEIKSISNMPQDFEIDILKAGHHGSSTSSSLEYLKQIKPEVGVISAGKNNSYGHPHEEVLSNFNLESVQLYRTDQLGDIKVIVDSTEFEIRTDKSVEKYPNL